MLHLPVDPRALLRLGRDHRLVTDGWSVELGYLVHAFFAAAFGVSLRPFDIQEGSAGSQGGRNLNVLAYTRDPDAILGSGAQTTGAVDWSIAKGKELPSFPTGLRLGFRVRVCPVVRVGKHHPRFAHGAEVDAYLNEVERRLAQEEAAHPDVRACELKQGVLQAVPSREEVYRSWLAARLAEGASLETARLVATSDALLWRRGVPKAGPARLMYGRTRPAHAGRAAMGRREAVFEGVLRVGDPAAFNTLLANGVGRHRAFGFGMLLLRPADPAC